MDNAYNIGSRLEPFVDDWLIERADGVALVLHEPVPQDVAVHLDKPWEGNSPFCVTVFQDGDICRLYYRGSLIDDESGIHTHQVTCYAESRDGIQWEKPELGLFDFKGSSKNSIVWTNRHGTLNFMPFKDLNPAAGESERYKAVAGTKDYGFYGFSSPDGLRWKRVGQEPFFPDARGTDWISSAFWDRHRGEYLSYHRAWDSDYGEVMDFTVPAPGEQPRPAGHMNLAGRWRSARYCSSKDFVHWTDTKLLQFDPPLSLEEQFYTSSILPYFRAPHILIGMPKRFVPHRTRMPDHPGGSGLSDGAFITSRDGLHWKRWPQVFIRAGLDPLSWAERSNLPALGVVQTGPGEMSVYWVEHYRQEDCSLRRGTLRTDGFVSAHAGYAGGELVTKPFTFVGRQLLINYSTSAAGSVRVEAQEETGEPIDGFTLAQCPDIYGDEIERVVSWEDGSDVAPLDGRPIRLRFVVKDADLYSMRFAHPF